MPDGKRPIIVYGGSFDPPHKGHLALASAALRQLKPAALYFVPGFRTPFRDSDPAPFSDRKAMLEAVLGHSALGFRPEVKISSFEAGRRRVVYTWETLEHFRALHPGAPLYFLLGSDCLAGFKRWRRWRGILKHARLLAGPRPGYRMDKRPDVPFTALEGVFPRASSSGIRAALFLGKKPAQVPEAALNLIKKRGLYLARERAILSRLITPHRMRHSLGTAELALELAPALGVPARKAAIAGLLHDCARDMAPRELAACAADLCSREPLLGTLAKEAPALLHACAGAALARELFGVRDREILEAIRLHAAGAPGMGALSRLIYVCDMACRNRDFSEAALVRELAAKDFEAAFRAANYVKLTHAFAGGGWVHPDSVSLWNSLQEK